MAPLEEKVNAIEKDVAVIKERQDGLRQSFDDFRKEHSAFLTKVVLAMLGLIGALSVKEAVVSSVGHTTVLEKAEFGVGAFAFIVLVLYMWYRVFSNRNNAASVITAVLITIAGLVRIALVPPGDDPLPIAVAIPFLMGCFSFFMEAITKWKRQS